MAGIQGEHHFAQKKPCSDLKSQRAKGSVTVSKTDSKDLNDSTVSFFYFRHICFGLSIIQPCISGILFLLNDSQDTGGKSVTVM